MNGSISHWDDQLAREYRKPRHLARREAQQMKFSFHTADKLSLSQYMIRKLNLLQESGITDQHELIYELWDGLDPVLMNAVQTYEAGDTLQEFQRRVRQQLPAAEKLWRRSQRNTTTKPTSSWPRPAKPSYRRPSYQQPSHEQPSYRQQSDRIDRVKQLLDWVTTKYGADITHKPAQLDWIRKYATKPKMPCNLCGGDHWMRECPTKIDANVKDNSRSGKAYKLDLDDARSDHDDHDNHDDDGRESNRSSATLDDLENLLNESENDDSRR
jgi:hypothetical protein